MSFSGAGRLLGEDKYLTPREREKRALAKERQAIERGLTPDWFFARTDLCLPPYGLDVAVIGAGFAGLMAAWYLQFCGARVTVFEAGARVGGRVLTDRTFVHPKVVEAGAELIGENHPLWRLFARHFKLELVPLTETYPAAQKVRTRFGGRDLSEQEKAKMAAEIEKPLAEIGREAKGVDEQHPWLHRKAAELDAISVAEKLDSLIGSASSLGRAWFEFTLGNDNCAPVAAQSYLGLLASVSAARMGSDAAGMLGYWLSTETHRCKDGNDLLSEHLGRYLGRTVRLRTAVTSVKVGPRGYGVKSVLIESSRRDADGKVVASQREPFHYAVLAAPPSVWGSIAIGPDFRPAEREIQHGPAVKFLSRHPTRFWEEDKLAPSAKWDELGSVWEGTDNQPGPPWFDLSVFSGGRYVLPAAEYPTRLTTIYPTRTTAPGSEQFVDWPSVPFIRTGYAVPGRGQASTICPRQWQPHEERLFFAGEQTSPGYFGYMEGALQSGARAARDVIRSAAVECPKRPAVQGLPEAPYPGRKYRQLWGIPEA